MKTQATSAAKNFASTLATGWGVKDGGTAAKLVIEALSDPPCGTARFEKRAVKAELRCKRAFTRLCKLTGERTAYALLFETQRMAWVESF